MATNVDVRNTRVKECLVHGSVPLATPVMNRLGDIGTHVGKLQVFGTHIQFYAGELGECRCARLDPFPDGTKVSVLENIGESVGSPALPEDVSVRVKVLQGLGGDALLSGAGVRLGDMAASGYVLEYIWILYRRSDG